MAKAKNVTAAKPKVGGAVWRAPAGNNSGRGKCVKPLFSAIVVPPYRLKFRAFFQCFYKMFVTYFFAPCENTNFGSPLRNQNNIGGRVSLQLI